MTMAMMPTLSISALKSTPDWLLPASAFAEAG
jgi:hypothetical protein